MRWLWLFALVLVSATAAWWLTREGPPTLVAPPPAADAAPVDAGAQQVAEPTPPAADAAVAGPLPAVDFASGFCAANGEAETFRVSAPLRVDVTVMPDSDEVTKQLARVLRERKRSDRVAPLRELAARAPQNLQVQTALAIAAEDPDVKLAALRAARQLAPSDPALGWAIADATRETADLDDAIDGLTAYLASDPQPVVSRLRARLEVARDIQAGDQRLDRAGITLLWPNGTLTAVQADALLAQVVQNLDEAARLTATTRRERLTVVVYNDRSELLAVACANAWTVALYDGTLRVVAANGPDGYNRTTLKHETLHAQLAPHAANVPKWFHEGLAQSFAQQVYRQRTWPAMVKAHTWIPFSSLDGSFQAFTSDADADLAYAQAYAMVELMRERGGDGAVAQAISELQGGASTPQALAHVLHEDELTGDELLEFMKRRLASH